MNPFQFVLAIVFGITLMGLVYDYLVRRLKYREKLRSSEEESFNAELVQRLDTLEERVRVLERIVTDESAGLRDRFTQI